MADDYLRILSAFRSYERFLDSIRHSEDYEGLRSLKLMYAYHMRTVNFRLQILSMLRLIIKTVMLPFLKVRFHGVTARHVVLETVALTDREVFGDSSMEIVRIQKYFALNIESFKIWKMFFFALRLLLRSKLESKRIWPLLHRLLDYYHVRQTLEIGDIASICMENDRFPIFKAVIDKARSTGTATIKFDYWLIDAIHHNDVYCDYYFYPNAYHRRVIEENNCYQKLRFVAGGFPNFDCLSQLKPIALKEKRLVYFTQFGIPFEQHRQHLMDLTSIAKEYKCFVKVHPREKVEDYAVLEKLGVTVLGEEVDSYELIRECEMVFSVFSTISLEAKHVIPNAFFINYVIDHEDSGIVDYDALGLEVIRSHEELIALFSGERNSCKTISEFVAEFNIKFPFSVEALEELCCHA